MSQRDDLWPVDAYQREWKNVTCFAAGRIRKKSNLIII